MLRTAFRFVRTILIPLSPIATVTIVRPSSLHHQQIVPEDVRIVVGGAPLEIPVCGPPFGNLVTLHFEKGGICFEESHLLLDAATKQEVKHNRREKPPAGNTTARRHPSRRVDFGCWFPPLEVTVKEPQQQLRLLPMPILFLDFFGGILRPASEMGQGSPCYNNENRHDPIPLLICFLHFFWGLDRTDWKPK